MLLFLINIFGCCAEVFVMRYFYKKLLGNTDKHRIVDYGTYFFNFLYSMYISYFVQASQMRSLCAVFAVIMPLYLYKHNFKIKLLYAIIYLSIQLMSELLTMSVALLPSSILPIEIGYMQGVVISKSIAFIIALIFISILHVRDIKMPYYLTFALLSIPIMSMFIIYELRSVFYSIDTASAYMQYLFTVALLIFSNFILFFLFEKNTELHWLKNKLAIQETRLEEQKTYYEKSLSMFQENRRLMHDFKNHLIAISGYLQNNQEAMASNYIAELTNNVQKNTILCSGYPAIDAVLTAKQQIAAQQDTEFLILELALPKNIVQIERDFALILATGLDNALDSTGKIISTEDRWIRILIRYHANYIYLQIENTTNNHVELKDNRVITTKNPNENHGIGLSTIKKIVEAHNGSLKLSCQEHVFSLTAMLSCSDDKTRTK